MKICKTFYCEIFLSGDLGVVEITCQEYCKQVGLCVTVEPLNFIYTGGKEAGVKVGLTAYPRFPRSEDEMRDLAFNLGLLLVERTFQRTFLIRTPEKTIWYNSEEE